MFRCPICRHKMVQWQSFFQCQNALCSTPNRACFLSPALRDSSTILAWGVPLLYQKYSNYYLMSVSEQYFEENPTSLLWMFRNGMTNQTILFSPEGEDILYLDTYFQYPTKKIRDNLSNLLERLIKMAPFQ
jgi:hypothetical protein